MRTAAVARPRWWAGPNFDPVFSPSGKRVLYVRDEDRGAGLFTVTPTGKRRKRIRRLGVHPVYGELSLTAPAWQPRP
jgi:hypothetical protein